MGIAEILIFAVCWMLVASLMLWGVFTERHRGPEPEPTAPALGQPAVADTDWVVVETTAGSGQEVQAQARMITAALLASRGIDIEALPPGDLRMEVMTTGDGASTTRVLVRAGAMHASRRRH